MEKDKTFLFSRDQTDEARSILSIHRKNSDLGSYRERLVELVRQASLKKQLILDGPTFEEPRVYHTAVDEETGETTTREIDEEKAQAFLAGFFDNQNYKKVSKPSSLKEIEEYLKLQRLKDPKEDELEMLDDIVDELAAELFMTDAEIAAMEASIYQKVQEYHKRHHSFLYD